MTTTGRIRIVALAGALLCTVAAVAQSPVKPQLVSLRAGAAPSSAEGLHLVVEGDAPLAPPRIRRDADLLRIWFPGTRPRGPQTLKSEAPQLGAPTLRMGYDRTSVLKVPLRAPMPWLNAEAVAVRPAGNATHLWLPSRPEAAPPPIFRVQSKLAVAQDPRLVPAPPVSEKTDAVAASWPSLSPWWLAGPAGLALLGLGILVTWLLMRRSRGPKFLPALDVVDSRPLGNGQRLVLVQALDSAHLLLVQGGRAQYCAPAGMGAYHPSEKYTVSATPLVAGPPPLSVVEDDDVHARDTQPAPPRRSTAGRIPRPRRHSGVSPIDLEPGDFEPLDGDLQR